MKLKRRILSKKVIMPNEKIKKIMKLRDNEELYRIEGLILNNHFSISLEISYLLKHLFPNLKSNVPERAGRRQDKEKAMERLRQLGYI